VTGELRVVQGFWEHDLSVALRFDDHFFGQPVPETLSVTLSAPSGRWLWPLSSPTPGLLRQPDGTYRFADIADGNYPVTYTSPSGDWVSWDPAFTLALPLPNPATLIVRQLWPAPQAAVPAGATAIRGKLVGANVVGLQVEIGPQGGPFDGHYNRTDSFGEFLYPILIPAPAQSSGELRLTTRVAAGARAVASVDIIDGTTVTSTLGPDFVLVPGKASRVKFNIT
jgi:hypothetical protein